MVNYIHLEIVSWVCRSWNSAIARVHFAVHNYSVCRWTVIASGFLSPDDSVKTNNLRLPLKWLSQGWDQLAPNGNLLLMWISCKLNCSWRCLGFDCTTLLMILIKLLLLFTGRIVHGRFEISWNISHCDVPWDFIITSMSRRKQESFSSCLVSRLVT